MFQSLSDNFVFLPKDQDMKRVMTIDFSRKGIEYLEKSLSFVSYAVSYDGEIVNKQTIFFGISQEHQWSKTARVTMTCFLFPNQLKTEIIDLFLIVQMSIVDIRAPQGTCKYSKGSILKACLVRGGQCSRIPNGRSVQDVWQIERLDQRITQHTHPQYSET